MSTNSQLRWRPQANRRRATFSAWAMSIVFVAIAVISFAVDQTVMLSPTAGDAPTIGAPLLELSPVRLIQSLIDTSFDRAE
jgi:hypothetical protein